MKKTLRRSMRTQLRSLPFEARVSRSTEACRRVLATDAWQAARTVFVYLSLEYELCTTPLLEAAWRDGKRVCAPKVRRDVVAMDPIPIRSWSDCLPGYRGIPEPFVGEPVAVSELDLVIVPGLAFDRSGNRLGQGGGYYDRFLAIPGLRAHRCGLGFDLQMLTALARDAHDVRMDSVVSEVEALICR